MAKKQKRPAKPAKHAKTNTPAGGPFLGAAVFCESVLEDKDRVMSAMRIVDNVNVTLPVGAPADAPSEEKPMLHLQTCLIIFKKGDARPGKYLFRLSVRSPDGKTTELVKQQVEWTDSRAFAGAMFKTAIPFKVTGSGTHWLNVELDGKRYTSLPLNFTIHRTKLEKGK